MLLATMLTNEPVDGESRKKTLVDRDDDRNQVP
jgi:hypothetical protein